jgi:drug/metabolite transporter (DMT)-like permease
MIKWALIGVVVLCNAFGDVLNSMGMKRHGEVQNLGPRHLLLQVGRILSNPLVLAGLFSLALSFFALLGLLSVADVSFAIPATALGYMVEMLLARLVLKEQVHWKRWAGAMLVAGGVLLLSL